MRIRAADSQNLSANPWDRRKQFVHGFTRDGEHICHFSLGPSYGSEFNNENLRGGKCLCNNRDNDVLRHTICVLRLRMKSLKKFAGFLSLSTERR